MTELWDLYDRNRNLLNKTHIRGVPLSKDEYHVVVDIWLINSNGEILIDKRHPNKTFGGFWECTGGAVIAGEDSKKGALRELEEELGIKANLNDLILINSIRLENRFVDTYVLMMDVEINSLTLQEEEVTEAKFVTMAELDELFINNTIFIKERYKTYRDKIEAYVINNNNG